MILRIAAVLSVALWASTARAQDTLVPRDSAGEANVAPPTFADPPGTVHTVDGRVVRPNGHEVVGVPGAWVLIHRVGSDTQGPLDSMRTDARGRYHFRYKLSGAEDAIYFAAAQYGGVAYFTAPFRSRNITGEDAEIDVFDTTSKPIPLYTRGRHIVVSAEGPEHTRTIVEVYEVSNDTTVTVVAGQGRNERATFVATLPDGARDMRVGDGDIPAGAVTFADGRALVFAPISPGLRQLSISYVMPDSAFPLAIPVQRPTQILEVLMEDTAAVAAGAGLEAKPSAAASGRMFKRWLAQDVPASGVVLLTVPAVVTPAPSRFRPVVLVILLAAMMLALGWAFLRGRRARPVAAVVPAAPVADDPERLAGEIAALDARFASLTNPDAAARASYERDRAELKAHLAAALARRD